MFGISFGELLIIGVIGLIVIGPERLPAVARTLGRLMRQVHDYTSTFKNELNRELHNAEILQLEREMEAEGRRLQGSLQQEFSEVQQQLEQVGEHWHQGTTAPPPAASAAPPAAATDLAAQAAQPPAAQPIADASVSPPPASPPDRPV